MHNIHNPMAKFKPEELNRHISIQQHEETELGSFHIIPSVCEQISLYLSSNEVFACDSFLRVNSHSIILASSVH